MADSSQQQINVQQIHVGHEVRDHDACDNPSAVGIIPQLIGGPIEDKALRCCGGDVA